MAVASRPGPYSPAPSSRPPRPRIAVIVSGWPRISETFALNELVALDRAGMLAAVVATKPGDASLAQPGWAALDERVTVLAPGTPAEQAAAAVVAIEAAGGADAVHGYFAHLPAEIAELTARHLGVPFGFSVHALDVRKVEPDELRRRAAAAATVVTCNADAAATLSGLGIDHRVLPHGVDVGRFRPRRTPRLDRTPTLLAVGRFVEKKGFPVLIDALARLDGSVRLLLVGDGPDRPLIEALVEHHGVRGRVDLLGRRTHDDLPRLYRRADLVVVPSVVDRDGDRDGLPNVVLEALASGVPIVASDVAAIGTAVGEAHRDGLLVPPGDPDRLAAAIAGLLGDRRRLARLRAGARRVATDRFDLGRCAARFCHHLELTHA